MCNAYKLMIYSSLQCTAVLVGVVLKDPLGVTTFPTDYTSVALALTILREALQMSTCK